MLGDLTAVASFADAKRLFGEAIERAARARALPAFAEACRGAVEESENPFVVPFAFAYAARAQLQTLSNWATEPNHTILPRPTLLAELDRLLTMPKVVNCRRNYFHGVIEAIRHYIVGDVEACYRRLAIAGQPSDYNEVFQHDFGVVAGFAKTIPTDEELRAVRGSRLRRGRLAFVRPASTTPFRMLVSISFDQIYAEAFAASWIERMPPLAEAGVGLHFHLMFGGAPEAGTVAGLLARADAAGLPLVLSVEDNVGWERAYFASARFLVASELLAAFGCPLLISDADAYVADAATFLAEDLPRLETECRVLAHINPPYTYGHLPWRRVAAGTVLLPANPLGHDFAATTADCLEYFWDAAPRPLWWIDQFALETARQVLLRRGMPEGSVADISLDRRRVFAVSETFKRDGIAAVPAMREAMAAGLDYGQALMRTRISLRNRRSTSE